MHRCDVRWFPMHDAELERISADPNVTYRCLSTRVRVCEQRGSEHRRQCQAGPSTELCGLNGTLRNDISTAIDILANH